MLITGEIELSAPDDPGRFRKGLADLGGLSVVIVGNIELATLQPLVETYLGSLPSHGRKAHWKDIGIKFPVGKLTKVVTAGSEAKARVELEMAAPYRWSLDATRDAAILSAVLQIRLREVLREDMGGVYSVRVGASISREPVQRRHLNISFGCDPANIDALEAAALGEIRTIAKSGIGADYLTKVSEQIRREHEVNLKSNGWWRAQLRADRGGCLVAALVAVAVRRVVPRAPRSLAGDHRPASLRTLGRAPARPISPVRAVW